MLGHNGIRGALSFILEQLIKEDLEVLINDHRQVLITQHGVHTARMQVRLLSSVQADRARLTRQHWVSEQWGREPIKVTLPEFIVPVADE